MEDLDAALDRALDHAYDVFGAQPPPRKIDACPCCVTPTEVAALQNTPPRDLDDDLAVLLESNLGLTLGGEREVRWFAPRLLEYWKDASASLYRLDGAAGSFVRFGWTAWRAEEVAALRSVWRAAFLRTLTDHRALLGLPEQIVALGRLGEDSGACIDAWFAREAELPEADRHLIHLRAFSEWGQSYDSDRTSPLGRYLFDPERLAASWELLDDPEFERHRDWLSDWIVHLLP